METSQHTDVVINSRGKRLEGTITSPSNGRCSFPGVVACHPHPLYGGDTNNPLVVAVCRGLADNGISALRFNFRGVGGSKGSFGKGRGEVDDLWSALNFLSHWPGINRRRIGIVGHSFGAAMALSCLQGYKGARCLVLISPPTAAIDGQLLSKNKRFMLFVVGDKDRTTPASVLKERLNGLGPKVQHRLVPGADHFRQGQETTVSELVTEFIAKALS